MKHILFFKIIMIFFVFGAGTSLFNEKYKGEPGLALIHMFIQVAIAILLGIGICLLP